MYVEELIGPDTVNTMPLETLEAFRDHGEVRGDTVLEGVDEAEQLLADLAAAGVDYDDVVATLEAEGVQKFADAFDELIAGIEARRGQLAAQRDDRAARARRADLVARPDGLDREGRGPLARLARRAGADARATSSAAPASPRTSPATARRRSCCSGWAARRSRPR